MAPPMLVPMMMLFNYQLFTRGTELTSSRSMVPYSMQGNPCDQGLSYQCFSEATATQCNIVRHFIFYVSYFTSNTIQILFNFTDLRNINSFRLDYEKYRIFIMNRTNAFLIIIS